VLRFGRTATTGKSSDEATGRECGPRLRARIGMDGAKVAREP
jgi:hypothetical protein